VKTIDYVRIKIDKLPKGYVFTYADFVTEVNKREAVIKSLNRLASSGKINKLSKGKFYKQENSVFGSLPPTEYQVVKDLLEKNGKLIGYITGYGIYNQLNLTTQVSASIQIGKNETRPAFRRDRYRISFIKQKNTITKENIPLLQILDAIRFIKKIPDASIESSCKRFIAILSQLQEQEIISLTKLAKKYPPSTRALLGALLEKIGKSDVTKDLRKSLNPITRYKLSIPENVLPSAKNWNIS